MTEYIEREALMSKLEKRRDYLFKENGDYDHYTNGFDEAVCRVEDAPAADVAPVVHGRWVKKGQDVYCSECDSESKYTWFGGSAFSNYCPNCGAKMDAEA
jgi:hypothetical protein